MGTGFVPPRSGVALRDKFPQNVSDIEWIEELAKEGDWVAFTADYDIVRQGAIKVAWKKAGLVGFVLRPELPAQVGHLLAFDQPSHKTQPFVHFGALLPRHLRLLQMPRSVTYVVGMICNL